MEAQAAAAAATAVAEAEAAVHHRAEDNRNFKKRKGYEKDCIYHIVRTGGNVSTSTDCLRRIPLQREKFA